MARPAKTKPQLPSAHRYMVTDGRLVDVAALSPVALRDIQAAVAESGGICPTCQGPMRVVVSDSGPVCEHTGDNPYAGHEPEDQLTRRAKHRLHAHLSELFPSGAVALDTRIPELGLLPDAVLVNPRGGKIAVEYQAQDLLADEVAERCDAYEKQGIRCLWLLDSRRLNMTKTGGLVRKAMLKQLETALLAHGQPLIYLELPSQVTWLHPHPEARELAELGEKRLGRVECLARRYRLPQLRLRDGHWWTHTGLDPRSRPPGELPPGLRKKLDKRRDAKA